MYCSKRKLKKETSLHEGLRVEDDSFSRGGMMRTSPKMCQTMDELSQANHQIHQYMDSFHGVVQINYNKR
jgi:hypothetical protein